jgi:hypothetical protein
MPESITFSLSDITALVTAVVALAGLSLSIYNLVVARREKRPQLKAKLSSGFLPRGPDIGPLMLLLQVANIGEKTVTVSSVEILWKKRSMVFIHGLPGTTQIPFELEAGKGATFWTPAQEVAASLYKEGARGSERLRARFRTAIDSEHLSRPLSFDVEAWRLPKS